MASTLEQCGIVAAIVFCAFCYFKSRKAIKWHKSLVFQVRNLEIIRDENNKLISRKDGTIDALTNDRDNLKKGFDALRIENDKLRMRVKSIVDIASKGLHAE